MLSVTNLAQFLRSRMERGVVRRGNAVTMARCFFGMLTHFVLLHDLFSGEGSWAQDPQSVASEVVDIWLDGILPRESPLRECSSTRRTRVTNVRSAR
jgi:hypothetical protein